ncbi:MAG: DUF4886 domain-containing protein [Clostridia bacterium]|nr:DUF4886 domain-containing protein [Clostridia bacterium]
MRTLSIGNSFSQDACGYLHQTAASAGIDWECVNLYIGGCSLEYHAENLREGRQNYAFEINGAGTGRQVSIPEALGEMGRFDFITLQQASHFSGMKETYFPFIRELYDACRAAQPDAEIVIHETWAYETDSTHGAFPNYGSDQRRMYACLRDAYREAAEALGVRLIPVGDAVQYLRENVPAFDYPHGGAPLTRDGFHLAIPDGRYLAALVWIETLAGADARDARYLPEGMTEERRALLAEEIHGFLHRT